MPRKKNLIEIRSGQMRRWKHTDKLFLITSIQQITKKDIFQVIYLQEGELLESFLTHFIQEMSDVVYELDG